MGYLRVVEVEAYFPLDEIPTSKHKKHQLANVEISAVFFFEHFITSGCIDGNEPHKISSIKDRCKKIES